MDVKKIVIKSLGLLLVTVLLFAISPVRDAAAEVVEWSGNFDEDPQDLWVDDDWVGTASGVEVEEGSGKIFDVNAFATITDAINAAADGDIIHVAAGTYTDDPYDSSLTTPDSYRISKSLTLLGAQAGVDPEGSTDRGNETVLVRTNGTPYSLYASGITIDGFTFTSGGGSGGGRLIIWGNNITVRNNIIRDISGTDAHGMYVYSLVENALVENNTFSNTAWEAILVDGQATINNNTIQDINNKGVVLSATSNAVLSGNVIANTVWEGIQAFASANINDNEIYGAYHGIQIRNDAEGWIISGNNIHDNDYYGLQIPNYGGSEPDVTGATISENTFTDNGTGGIEIGGSGDGSGLNISENDFSGQSLYAVNAPSLSTSADAAPNWWGSEAGPAAGKVEGNVIYNPWYNTDAMTTKTYLVGADQPFTSIQSAIDAASDGDTILVSAGTYDLSATISVNKAVTILGSSTGVTKVVGVGGDTVKTFEITSGNVTIKDFEITLGSPPNNQDGIISVPDLAIDNIQIINNEIYVDQQAGEMSGWFARAINVGSDVTGLVVSGNTMYNTRSGLVVHYNSEATITDNVIYNTKGGIMNYTNSIEDYQNRVIQNNSWNDVHNEWDIVWNSGGGPYEQDYNESVLGVSQANNDAYVVSLMTTDSTPETLTGNRSHVFVDETGTTEKFWSNGNMNLPYASIQDAIDAAVPGGKVIVSPGTYEEQIELNKPNITVQSTDGADVTIIDVPDGTLTIGVKVLANMGTVTFDGFTVKDFTESGIVQGMSAREGTTFHVLNNKVIPENGYLRNGIQVSGDSSTVIGNFIEGAYLTEEWASTGIMVVNASNVLVQNNEISGEINGMDGGIVVLNYEVDSVHDVVVKNNVIYDVDYPLDASARYGTVSNVTFEYNNVTGYIDAFWAEVYDDGISVTGIDASPNWWGSKYGPLSPIYGEDVTVIQWCADEACTEFLPGPDNVIELSGEIGVDGGIPVYVPGVTYLLKDGTVVQNNSPCFFVNADNTTIKAESTGGATCVATSGSSGIEVADGVKDITVEGLEITGDGSAGQNGIAFLGAITNLQIVDNFIHDLTADGIFFTEQPAAETSVSLYIQGNLFKDNGGVGVNNSNGTGVDATYNAWGDVDGPAGTNGDGVSANVGYDPWTHVDLYMVSTNPNVDNWPNQVFIGEDITYQVKADMANVTAASFEFSYPTALLGSPTIENVTTLFDAVPTDPPSDLVVVDEVSGVISFDGSTTTAVNGEVVLFEVTFTSLQPGDDVLDFNDDEDVFGMSPDEGPSLNIYADALMDSQLKVITRPTLTATGLDGQYVAGISHEITTEICNAATGGEWIESPGEPDAIGWIRISDITIGEIASLQFLYDGLWYDFSVQDAYGGQAVQQDGDDVIARFGNYNFGFDIPADWCDYDAFRVTFVNPGSHEITIEIFDMMDTVYDGIDPDDILLTSIGPVGITVDGNFNVTGTVAMQGREVRSGVPLTLTDINGEPVYGPFNATSTIELADNVLFTGVNGSIYQITTNQPRYLNVTADMDKHFLVNNDYQIEALELKGGNARWTDNVINVSDASIVGGQYGSAIFDDGDVNFDDRVNIQDLALVGGNYGLTSEDAYADWLTPEYNGYVSGVISSDETGGISGSVSGDYNLIITGQIYEDYGSDHIAYFNGTVTGDFEGTITGGKVSNMGIDPLYAVIDVNGTTETVRLVGNFVKSGIKGHFKGNVITGPELDPVQSIVITSPVDTVGVGGTLQMTATTDPAGREVLWSIYIDPNDPNAGDAFIDEETGLLTGLEPGPITVVVVAKDDSNLSYANKAITVIQP